MAINIIVHGVTSGFDSSESKPSPYFQNFYNRPKGYNYFIAEIFRDGAGPKSCYTLYISRNVANSGNRPGSYFAISVLIDDKACADVKALYSSLSGIFKSSFVGRILVRQGDGYKFKIGRFADEGEYISLMTGSLFSQISNLLKNNLVDIDGSFNLTGNSSGRIQANPNDLSDSDINKAIRRDGGIILSDEFPSAAQQRQLELERKQREREVAEVRAEKERQLEQERIRRERETREAALREQALREQAKRDSERQLQQKNAEIEAVRNSVSAEIKALKKTISEKDTVIREYNKEYQKLATLYDGLNSRMAKAEMTVAKMNTDVAQLGMNAKTQPSGNGIGADGFLNLGDEAANHHPRHRSGNNPQHLKWILGIFGVIVLAALLFAFFPKSTGSDKQTSDYRLIEDKLYNSLQKTLKTHIDSLFREMNYNIVSDKVGIFKNDMGSLSRDEEDTPKSSDMNDFMSNYIFINKEDGDDSTINIELKLSKSTPTAKKVNLQGLLDNMSDEDWDWTAYAANDVLLDSGKGKKFEINKSAIKIIMRYKENQQISRDLMTGKMTRN